MEHMINMTNKVDFYLVLMFWMILFLFVICALSRAVYVFFRKYRMRGVGMVLYGLLIMVVFGTPVWEGITVYLALKDIVWAGIACINFMLMTIIGGFVPLLILDNYLASYERKEYSLTNP